MSIDSVYPFTPFRVAKFGGTSVANFDAMNRSANIILANPNIRLVVLSASAGVTNLLVDLAQVNNAQDRANHLDKIINIQYEIISHLTITQQTWIIKEIEILINTITILAETAGIANSAALKDELISHGELMSTMLFVEVLRQLGVETEWFDIRKVMRTNDNFGCAKPDSKILKENVITILGPHFLQEKVIVTQGFIGSEAKGRTTTLGRGGSDYTAALLGEALKATRIDIWTDVPGIYTTDPNLVPNAKPINVISFEEATEMAKFGAKILHPETLRPAIRSEIPVFVGSSKEPNIDGTLIYNHTIDAPLFRALTLRRKQILLTLHSLKILYVSDFLAKIFNIFAKHAISLDIITTSDINIALIIDKITVGNNLNTILTELSVFCQIKVEANLALIAIIGNNLSQACGISKEIFGLLDQFSIRVICHGASSHNICILVPDNDADEVISILHSHLFD